MSSVAGPAETPNAGGGTDPLYLREQQVRFEHQNNLNEINQEIDRKLTELQERKESFRSAKDAISAALSIEFVDEIVGDEVWKQASENPPEAFNTKYLQHKFKLVRDMAHPYMSQIKAQSEVDTLQARKAAMIAKYEGDLKQLAEDRLSINILPCELYRMIRNLTEELAAVKAKIVELEQQREREQRERAERAQLLQILNFTVLNSNNITLHKAADGALPYELSKINQRGHSHAISADALPRDRPMSWTVELVTVPTNSNWLFLGIIGSNQGVPAESYGQATSYGWAGSQQVYIGGRNNNAHDGWTTWETGDKAVFTYNPMQRKLTTNVTKRNGTKKEYTISNIQLGNAYINCDLYDIGTVVKFTEVHDAAAGAAAVAAPAIPTAGGDANEGGMNMFGGSSGGGDY